MENYRVQFTRRERVRGESEKSDATFTLFSALGAIHDFLDTFWSFGGVFYFLFLLLGLVCGLKYWLAS